jgi:Protein of unknown function (DUF3443)
MRQAKFFVILGGLCLLSACGGGGSHGGGGGGGGGGGHSSSDSIGGTVSGLTASGLVLENNGGDSLTVVAGATTFTFPTGVSPASAYAVTIQTQPTGEKCLLFNASGTANGNVTNVGVSCGNSVGMDVAPGPASASYQTFNIPLTSVTVCVPSSNADMCATIPDVLVDTGSSGLRLMASALSSAGITLPALNDPNNSANTIAECGQFAGGYTWGPVESAAVIMGAEQTKNAVQIQVINDGANATPGAGCAQGASLNSVNAFDANGVLGVGVFDQDCGTNCSQEANHIYYTCTSSNTCTPVTLALADQVSNPVAAFTGDNTGVVLQLPSVPAAGQAGATGSLIFGIGTESDNALGNATVLTADALGNFTTNFNGTAYTESLLDSGSNAFFFADSSLQSNPCASSGPGASFYCPPSTQSLTASNQGANGTQSSVSFQIANLNNISTSFFAINDVGGPMSGSSFDWGLPFFYGRSTFVLFEATSQGGTYGAYAY